jgi:hypothetical protein
MNKYNKKSYTPLLFFKIFSKITTGVIFAKDNKNIRLRFNENSITQLTENSSEGRHGGAARIRRNGRCAARTRRHGICDFTIAKVSSAGSRQAKNGHGFAAPAFRLTPAATLCFRMGYAISIHQPSCSCAASK